MSLDDTFKVYPEDTAKIVAIKIEIMEDVKEVVKELKEKHSVKLQSGKWIFIMEKDIDKIFGSKLI